MKTFYAVNRYNHVAQLLPFEHWEQVQGAFRCGIKLADDSMATGIGRCADKEAFYKAAQTGQWYVLAVLDAKTGPVIIKANPNKMIFWCSHWEQIDDLVGAGFVTRLGEHQNFHHREYYVR